MDHIKASEDSFGRANNYYILMWVMTALIVVTAFLEFRTHRLEESANQQCPSSDIVDSSSGDCIACC